MKGIGAFVFPAVMLVGLLVSAFVVAAALQAAELPTALPAAEIAAAPVSRETMVGQGRALFLAKGCIVCHQNDRAMAMNSREFSFDNVPNLTQVKIDEAYLRRWLRDPKAVKPGTEMPNLHLADDEIDALVAFLRSE